MGEDTTKTTQGTNPTVVFQAPGVVELVDRPLGTLAAGELLLKTRRSLISTGTELTLLSGAFEPGSAWDRLGGFPFTAGYSNVADVIAVPDGEDPGAWIGARVASAAPHAKYAIVPAHEVQRVIASDELLESQTFTTLGQIAMNGVRRADVRLGEAVVVVGLGLLGQLTARLARAAGARPVIGIDHAARRIECLPEDPAVIRIDASKVDPVVAVREATRGRMADVVVEATGNPAAIAGEFLLLRESEGRLLVLSSPRGSTTVDFHDISNAPSHTIIGAHLYSHPKVETPSNPWTMDRNAEVLFGLMADGSVDLRPLITARAAYTRAPQLYEMLVNDRSRSMGVILDWDAADEAPS